MIPPGTLRWTILLVTCLSSSACAWLPWLRPVAPFASTAQCKIRPDLSLSELIAHLNANTDKIQRWHSTSARITTRGPGGLPIQLSANLAVESPRRFRLVAHSVLAKEADFGSNDEEFWIWMKADKPQRVITCHHEDFGRASSHLPIPFQPDWIIEALGVTGLDAAEHIEERSTGDPRFVNLLSWRTSPQGEPLTKVVTVDRCHGIVVGHSLYNMTTGLLIAKATLSQHVRDATGGAVIARRVDLQWPQSGMQKMTIRLDDIQVNPPYIAEEIWQRPVIPDVPVLNLGQTARVYSRQRDGADASDALQRSTMPR